MVTLAMVLTAIGVPAPGLALVLGVDRLLDMFRTATNVAGDSSVTAFMARLDGEDLRILTDEEDAARVRLDTPARREPPRVVRGDVYREAPRPQLPRNNP